VAERLIDEGVADYISMSRPLIREPDLINRWKAGDLSKAACVSDNMCFKPILEGKGIARKKNNNTQLATDPHRLAQTIYF
jgi:2,4-dienoyl-CoA reductase-like NADH-dependent reductase (Old Yellow Enzyme family)